MKTAKLDPAVLSAYRFFLQRGGYCTPPGRVSCAMSHAKDEARAKEMDLLFSWEDELESYGDVWGEPLPPNVDGPYCLVVYGPQPEDCESIACEPWDHRHKNHREHLCNLGMITLPPCNGPEGSRENRDQRRVVEAELASEALATLDAERDAIATLGANELAQRATFAGPGVES